jgi:hypothetical protein
MIDVYRRRLPISIAIGNFSWDTTFCLFSLSMRRADITPMELSILLEFRAVVYSAMKKIKMNFKAQKTLNSRRLKLLLWYGYHESLSINLFGEININNELGAYRSVHFKTNLILITFIRGIEETHETLILVWIWIVT